MAMAFAWKASISAGIEVTRSAMFVQARTHLCGVSIGT